MQIAAAMMVFQYLDVLKLRFRAMGSFYLEIWAHMVVDCTELVETLYKARYSCSEIS
jgi:hypothetical protein